MQNALISFTATGSEELDTCDPPIDHTARNSLRISSGGSWHKN